MPKIKPESHRAVVRSYSMPRFMLEEAESRAEALGYLSFSDYIRFLVMEDLAKDSPHIREITAPYQVKTIDSESQTARNARTKAKNILKAAKKAPGKKAP